ncbi:hypothetical protein GCM10017602_17820 [Herbiconiux flava]|nr:hypothetical protein GCM10017602_17820 [Herbiconiux flava]
MHGSDPGLGLPDVDCEVDHWFLSGGGGAPSARVGRGRDQPWSCPSAIRLRSPAMASTYHEVMEAGWVIAVPTTTE